MARIKHFVHLVLIISLSAILAGCAEGEDEKDSLPGLANPASVYCQGLDFEEVTRENELGQYGVCLFPDGSECDSWDFLAGRCGQENTYCVQQGYKLEATENSNIGTCIFNDGSTCGEFAYFQGECKPGESYP